MRWLPLLLLLACPAFAADKPAFKVGVARKTITPDEPLWMAGYASRTKPAEGKLQNLYVKAVAIEDPQGHKFVLLTSDLIGLSRELTEAVVKEVSKKTD